MMPTDSLIITLDRFQHRLPWWAILLGFLTLEFVFQVIYSSWFYEPQVVMPDVISKEDILYALLVGPIFESIIFQVLIVEAFMAVSKFLTRRRFPLIAAIISAVLFSLAHAYGWCYIIGVSVGAMCLSLNYLIFRHRKTIGFGFLMTALLHALFNFNTLLANLI